MSLIIYHGSSSIIERPVFGAGKTHNDYGQGFYCTERLELAKEWACTTQDNGYANQYHLNTQNLSCFNISQENILAWMAILVENRTFEIKSALGAEAKAYLLEEFLPAYNNYDVLIGYRADDSYFSFAENFLNGTLSLNQLSKAMQLGNLGQQIVLKTQKAFEAVTFETYHIADSKTYFPKRSIRDSNARQQFRAMINDNAQSPLTEIYMLDILRGRWKHDDSRICRSLPE